MVPISQAGSVSSALKLATQSCIVTYNFIPGLDMRRGASLLTRNNLETEIEMIDLLDFLFPDNLSS